MARASAVPGEKGCRDALAYGEAGLNGRSRRERPKDYHVVGITMARTNLLVSIHDRVALDGIAMPGGFLVTEPGVAASCIFKGPLR